MITFIKRFKAKFRDNMQSWARDNIAATKTMRQRNWASGTRQNLKNIKVLVSRWSSHNKYSNIAKINHCVAWKHGHVRWNSHNKYSKVILQKQTTLCPEKMVTLSRQYCRVPSSDKMNLKWKQLTWSLPKGMPTITVSKCIASMVLSSPPWVTKT